MPFGAFPKKMPIQGWITKSSFTLSLILITQGLAAKPAPQPDNALSHKVGSFELLLNNDGEECQLTVKNTSSETDKIIPLLLSKPCYWVTSSKSNTLLKYGYEQIAVDHTLLVAGTPLDWTAEKKAYQKIPENTYCTQFLQGVVLSEDQVFAVDEKMIAAHCETGLAIDEKIFYAMAHNPERYQEKAKTPDAKALKVEQMTEGKSFIDSVTDSIKSLFTGKPEDSK